jgi:hypothetical protein
METNFNSLDLIKINLLLFLEIVGGHHLMLNMGEGKIIKITSESEGNFYRKYSDLNLSFIPKCFYFLNRKENPELDKLVLEYKEQLDFVIYEIVRDYDESQIRALSINQDFNDSLDTFYEFTKKCEENINLKKDYEGLKVLQENFSKFTQEKLRFYLHYFIYKVMAKIDKSYFVILEDLTHNMQRPCLIDIKLGYIYGKLSHNYKKGMPESITDLGLRLMGAQVIKFFSFSTIKMVK